MCNLIVPVPYCSPLTLFLWDLFLFHELPFYLEKGIPPALSLGLPDIYYFYLSVFSYSYYSICNLYTFLQVWQSQSWQFRVSPSSRFQCLVVATSFWSLPPRMSVIKRKKNKLFPRWRKRGDFYFVFPRRIRRNFDTSYCREIFCFRKENTFWRLILFLQLRGESLAKVK